MKKSWATGFVVVLSFILLGQSSASAQQNIPEEVLAYPDIVLYNGKVLTAKDDFAVAEAVAIRDGKFLAVGDNTRIRRLAGPKTRQIDLGGRSAVPGLWDPHLHQAWVGQVLKTGTSNLRLKDLASGLEEVKQIVAKAKPGEWLFLGAPDNTVLVNELNRKVLDPISPNNPLVIVTGGNVGAANSLALKVIPPDMAGQVKDPQTGEPTGSIAGFTLGYLAYDVRPQGQVTEEDIQLQKQVLKKLNSQGLTTVIGRAQGQTITVLKEIWARGELTTRVRFAHEFLRQNPYGEAFLKRMGNLSGFGDPMMKIHGTTIQPVDGLHNSGAALTYDAKIRVRDTDPFGSYGRVYWEDWGSTKEHSEYQNIILANRYGWNIVSLHSVGDKSTDWILDAYEQANREKPLKGRWAIDHSTFRTDRNISRAKELGVIFSVVPGFIFKDSPDSLIYQYGADKVNALVPTRKFIDAGMKPVMESDTRGEYSAPLWNMEVLITRNNGAGGRTWGADQKITRQEALWMKTNWAARYSNDENILGTVEAGKLADLVVLGGDYMTVPEDRISELPIDLTIVDGKVMYEREKEGIIRLPYWDGVVAATANPMDR